MLRGKAIRLTALALLAIGLACPTIHAQGRGDAVDLSMVFGEGERDTYVLTMEGTMCADCPPAVTEGMPLDLSQSLEFSLKVELGTEVREVVGDVASLSVRVDRFEVELGGLDRTARIEADNTKARVLVDGEAVLDSTEGVFADFPIAALLFGRELFVIEVDTTGDIRNIGLTGLLSAVADTPAVQKLFAQIAGVIPALLPGRPVRVGETWEAPMVLSVPDLDLEGSGDLRFILRSAGDTSSGALVQIGLRGTLGVADFPLTDALMGLPMIGEEVRALDPPSVRLSGLAQVRGEMYLDPTNHRPLTAAYTVKLRTQIDSGIPGMTADVIIDASCSINRTGPM